MKINVLGTEYEIVTDVKDDPKLGEHADGYCDFTIKKIAIAEMEQDDYTMADLGNYKNKVIRHEIVHAFLYESGLDVNSDWARNEELIDWIALQLPKINKAIERLDN